VSGICIVQLGPDDVSDTFIRAHVERLSGVNAVVTQRNGVPHLGPQPMLSPDMLARAGRRGLRIITRRNLVDDVERAFVKAIRQARADVVLAEYGPCAVRVRRACEILNVPLVAHFHGYDAWLESTIEQHRDGYAALFRSAAAVVSGCRSMTARLLELGANPDTVVTNYVSTVVPEDFPEVDCGARPPRFVAVGRFVEKKAPHLTLLAFARMVSRCPDSTLHFIGDGPLLGACRQLARALGVSSRVEFFGAREPGFVRRELQAARCFVQHSAVASNGDREGTGISVLEAAMTGLAVCATRHEGIAETMRDGDTALLVDEYDVDGMAERMLSLATNPILARRLGRTAAQHARKHFTMNQSIGRLSRLLDVVARREDIGQVRVEIEAEWLASTGVGSLAGIESNRAPS
jgi:colanic acid/amylovoran biosynthesis glycosyltransferase